jgi:hypothetical protein
MKPGDLVMLTRDDLPVIGEIVAATSRRFRIAIKSRNGYISVIRKNTTIQIAKKARKLL